MVFDSLTKSQEISSGQVSRGLFRPFKSVWHPLNDKKQHTDIFVQKKYRKTEQNPLKTTD